MSPLQIKTRNLEGTGWIKLGDPLMPGDAPGSISNNPPGREREVYVFYCEKDNSSSVIQKTIRAREDITGRERSLSRVEFEKVAKIKEGDEPFDLDVKTDYGTETTIRFIHKER